MLKPLDSSAACSRPACGRQARLYHLGGLFQTPLYHLHPCRRTSMQAYIHAGVGRWFQTRLYHPALAGTPPEEGNWNHLGGLFQTPLYHLHPCRRASMQAGLRRNDNKRQYQ